MFTIIFQSRDMNKLFSFQVEFTEKHALGREESKAVSFSSDLAEGRDQWVRKYVLAKLKSLKSCVLTCIILNLILYLSQYFATDDPYHRFRRPRGK